MGGSGFPGHSRVKSWAANGRAAFARVPDKKSDLFLVLQSRTACVVRAERTYFNPPIRSLLYFFQPIRELDLILTSNHKLSIFRPPSYILFFLTAQKYKIVQTLMRCCPTIFRTWPSPKHFLKLFIIFVLFPYIF